MTSVKHLAASSAAVGALIALAWLGYRQLHHATPAALTTPATGLREPAAETAPKFAADAAPAAAVVSQARAQSKIVVGRNDTMDSIFRRLALSMADLTAMRRLPVVRQSLDHLQPGEVVNVLHTAANVQELDLKLNETRTLEVMRGAAGFTATLLENPVETRVRTSSATIDTSLFQAAEAAHISDPVALRLANVFAWDIDFVLDIREGDRFTAVYEQIYQDGKYLRDGEVLAAAFVNNGRLYRAVRFVSDAGSAGYFAPDGRPMHKAFLRAPVDFTRVSSAFNPHRRHPILNTIRGHMGTDYAAPTGTPVHAAGDGRVSFAGTRGGYGNAVVLAHGANISTLYGHLSRIARTTRVGAQVRQGDVIGYVGMTGLATGPHLHYEYLMNGVHRNPQTVQLPGAEPLRADALEKFRNSSAPLIAALNRAALAPHVPAGEAAPAATAPVAAADTTGATTTMGVVQ